ncbi:MAG: IS5/IS1182 family transposase, partial [Pseudolabrys sp.]|nr:IS5/IS1182 family transposase [Pseudolabrys sp.]
MIPSDWIDSKESTMAWTEITRRQYRREGLRYESDTMDAERFV